MSATCIPRFFYFWKDASNKKTLDFFESCEWSLQLKYKTFDFHAVFLIPGITFCEKFSVFHEFFQKEWKIFHKYEKLEGYNFFFLTYDILGLVKKHTTNCFEFIAQLIFIILDVLISPYFPSCICFTDNFKTKLL